jgi:phosphoribulokinase
MLIFSFVLTSIKRETTIATAFLKNAFSIVGISPDILTKNVINEKPSAANKMQIMPFDLLLMAFNLLKSIVFPYLFQILQTSILQEQH